MPGDVDEEVGQVGQSAGRAVLVTGAARGIGAAVARAFADGGDRVAVHHSGVNSREDAEAVAAGLPGGGHAVVCGDVADPSAVAALVDEAARLLEGIDVLVNNAGVFLPHPVDATTYDEWQATWQQTLAVNLLGPANAIWCAVRHMTHGGRIVNIGSRGAFRGEPECPAYGASKAGLHALGQSLAVALAPRGIAVAGVAPGFVETAMAREAMQGERGEQVRRQSPFGRVARVEEVASAVHWLASPHAEWASGTIIDVNGASYLRT